MRYLINNISLSIILLSAAIYAHSQDRYFDYSGKDGCSPANIGHRLGGDLDEFSNNSLEGMNYIATKQDSHCFKNWEFDLSEWKGNLYLSHDAITSKEQTKSLVTLHEFEIAFTAIKATKPIVIDMKAITSETALIKAVTFARNMRSTHEPDIWFLVSPDNEPVLTRICPLVSGVFDVMLYRRGGEYCGHK
jgi:hypothetical protein